MAEIICMKNWGLRNKYSNLISEISKVDGRRELKNFTEPATFYIFEPLRTRFSGFAVFDKCNLRELIGNTGRFGTPQEIMLNSAVLMKEYFKGKVSKNEDIEAVYAAALVNFALTQTAAITVNSQEDYRHFGVILFDNPNRENRSIGVVRPMASIYKDLYLSSTDYAMTMCEYIVKENELHPEYFEGLDLRVVIRELLNDAGIS